MNEDPVLIVEDHGAVRLLRLNRSAKHNALNTALTAALLDALEKAAADPSVHAVVLCGAGKSFCAGADLGEFKDLTPDNQDLVMKRAELSARMYAQLRRMAKPIVAAVQGAAAGGGAGLALGSDMLVAASDVRLGFPEVKHSIVPALVMSLLQGQVGPKMGFELVSTGRMLGADDLQRLAVANRVTPPEQVVDAALELAQGWAKTSPLAMAAVKDLFYRASDLPFEAGMAAGRDVNALMRSFRNGS